MGLVDVVQNRATGELYTVSTIPRERYLSLPGLGKVYVICEAAVYKGRVNPLKAVTKKPLFVAYHFAAYQQFSLEQVHDIFTSACEQLRFIKAADLIEPLEEHIQFAVCESSRQLLTGLRKVDMLYIS